MFRVKSIKSKERKDVMKTQNIVTILMIAILSVLFDTEQAYAVTYGKPYRGATVPQAQFYSTGDITTSSGAKSTPLLNENGLVVFVHLGGPHQLENIKNFLGLFLAVFRHCRVKLLHLFHGFGRVFGERCKTLSLSKHCQAY